jgi:hypothetical protein
MFLSGESTPTVTNTIFAFNSSGIHTLDASDVPTLRYNCVYGNTEYDYFNMADPTGIEGNISADPLFVQNPDWGADGAWGTDDEARDLRLQFGSPCIDAGDNGAVPGDILDMDNDGDVTEPLPYDLAGLPRFVDHPFVPDTGMGLPPVVDMGAYEHQPDLVGDLEDAVVALGLPHGIERSLLAKLAAASRALEDSRGGNDGAACNALRAFVHALEALSGRQVGDEEVAALVEAAEETLAVLGCMDGHGRGAGSGSLGRGRAGRGR